MEVAFARSEGEYVAYARQLEANMDEKFSDTVCFVRPGRVGDIGCASGSWLSRAVTVSCFGDSEMLGVESDLLAYSSCQERFRQKCRRGANISVHRKNAGRGLVFPPRSMDTIHTSSVTHEVYSQISPHTIRGYLQANPSAGLAEAQAVLGDQALCEFIKNRFAELKPGGVWINRDVVGPENRTIEVCMELSRVDGETVNNSPIPPRNTMGSADKNLASQSTYQRFLSFAQSHQELHGHACKRKIACEEGRALIQLTLGDAWEFALKKDYVDNWMREMLERFCHWSFSDWICAVEKSGFRTLSGSCVFTNSWIVEHRLRKRLSLFNRRSDKLEPMPYPPTTMVLVLQKPRE